MKITLKQRFGGAVLIGLAGLAVAITITMVDRTFRGDMAFIRCAAAGAFLAGLVFAGAFGRTGSWGWFRAGLGFGGATVLGGIFAVMLLPLDQSFTRMGFLNVLGDLPEASLMGPVYVVTSMSSSMVVTCVWALGLAGIHGASMRLRGANPRLSL